MSSSIDIPIEGAEEFDSKFCKTFALVLFLLAFGAATFYSYYSLEGNKPDSITEIPAHHFISSPDIVYFTALRSRLSSPKSHNKMKAKDEDPTAALYKNYMNPEVNPCDDFYEYACGTYSSQELPSHLGYYSPSDEANDRIYQNLQVALESAPKTSSEAIEKMRLFFKSCKALSTEKLLFLDPEFKEFSPVLEKEDEEEEEEKSSVDISYCLMKLLHMPKALNAFIVRQLYSLKEGHNELLEMMHYNKQAMSEMFDEALWLDEITRINAKKKLEAMNMEIVLEESLLNDAYLDMHYHWVKISPEMGALNIVQAYLRQTRGKVFSALPSYIVNAFYMPTANSLKILYGYINAFYNSSYPMSRNYGVIATTIGHEITHGFDNKGMKYNENGREKEWWTALSKTRYRLYSQCFVKQYGEVDVEEKGPKIDGKKTLGENIADNGGIKMAFKAYKKFLRRNKDKLVAEFNFTNEQNFFLGYAHSECNRAKPGVLTRLASIDVHSPSKARVNVVLSNMAEFGEAFHCPRGSPMNPWKKCKVW